MKIVKTYYSYAQKCAVQEEVSISGAVRASIDAQNGIERRLNALTWVVAMLCEKSATGGHVTAADLDCILRETDSASFRVAPTD